MSFALRPGQGWIHALVQVTEGSFRLEPGRFLARGGAGTALEYLGEQHTHKLSEMLYMDWACNEILI
ncbi:hypothetical protein IP76_12755 [Rhizobium sp. AAP43]|nr:hypothetical protein IP76_12755 [Rhizobium sp. AAP43]